MNDVNEEGAFAGLRGAVAADPAANLSTWGTDLASFMAHRDEEYQILAGLEQRLLSESDPERRKQYLQAHAEEADRIASLGRVSARLLAIAGFHDLSHRYAAAKPRLFAAAALAGVGIVAFLVAASSAPKADPQAPTQVPAMIAVAPGGAGDATRALLGPSCPSPFRGIVLAGGQRGPWDVLVTDPQCTSGTVSLTKDQVTILLVFDQK